MHALAKIKNNVPDWKYICKVWPQPRTTIQNRADLQLATQLRLEKNVSFVTNITSRDFMPYLMGACDIYAAPSRLEGFGMSQIEAGACGKPVVSIRAMGMLDTLIHGETALLANVAQTIVLKEAMVGEESGFEKKRKVVFDPPRIAEYRASVDELADYLLALMTDSTLREKLGEAARSDIVKNLDYRVVAKRFVQIINEKLGIK